MDFKQYHAQVVSDTQILLSQCIRHYPTLPCDLLAAMEYALLGQGKRMRPLLISLVGDVLGVSKEKLAPLMVAIECIHAYSLVHDDLPDMDDDDLRRGMPTCHIQYTPGTAILVGDALQSLAFEHLAQHPVLSASEKVAVIQILAKASGYEGMCGGQAIDLHFTNQDIDLETLTQLHRLKTGALLGACVDMVIALVPSLDVEHQALLHTFSRSLGLAFQVQDDILDITSDSDTLGKPSGSDQDLNKSTFPALLGLQASQEYLDRLYTQALQSSDQLPYNTAQLNEFAAFLVKRNH
ncbi:polyprenyl synthetase family protein [Glaciecola sp. HTCC2999]|uniref:polyprenyl synthetase family protein n=1 Tax=Glaciecola sp. HTCC2999 TaxID=455436 RepID=UPI0000E0E129|nr:farnesyl diphosphate synthase [Glaciecola sp. HTCC2999]